MSKEQLEKAVLAARGRRAGVPVDSVSCESGLDGKVGAVAHCDVDAGGVKLRRTVEVNSVEGLMMNFDVVPVLTKAEVESSLLDELETQRGRAAGLGASARATSRASRATPSTAPSSPAPDTAAFTLTVTTVEGSKINYRYAPQP